MTWFQEKDKKFEEISLFDAQEKIGTMIKLPLYQRDSVWSEERVCALWDSLLRGFPLPSFLLTKGEGKSREFQSSPLGKRGISRPEKEYYDLLDGQQRMTAINAAFVEGEYRLWIDLAPEKDKDHPFKYKYWVHACTKVFPFGFRMQAAGDHEFAVLHDNELDEISKQLQKHDEFAQKELFELPLYKTFPYNAGCPVPLDKLLDIVKKRKCCSTDLRESILALAEECQKTAREIFTEREQNKCQADESMIKLVVDGLINLCNYKLSFQLIRLNGGSDDDDYLLYERIGRGGIQITPRQLAVSKLMIELGVEGNNAISSFQSSEELINILETEDIIHAVARVALIDLEKSPEPEERKKNRDLVDLTPERLKSIKKDTELWKGFVGKLKDYVGTEGNSKLLKAFTDLYKDLRYSNQNGNGFSKVQLAQPYKKREGISPVTLHPLLYLYITKGSLSDTDRNEMLRWVLFANGLTSAPGNLDLNREIFTMTVDAGKIDFSKIREKIFGDDKLKSDLGFNCYKPMFNSDGILSQHYLTFNDIPTPDEIKEITIRRLVLNGNANSGVSNFVLLWNQRELMEKLYGTINYFPALFSKGRPFDADHIFARNKLTGHTIDDTIVRNGALLLLKEEMAIHGNENKYSDIESDIKTVNQFNNYCFRLSFPNINGNYRFWPKSLNRHDHDDSVASKLGQNTIDFISKGPLSRKLQSIKLDDLWRLSAIPPADSVVWLQLPPAKWDASYVHKFLRVALRRECFLYENAHQFIQNQNFRAIHNV